MKEQRDNGRRPGLLIDILSIGQSLVKLAGTYVLLIREELWEEAKAVGRRTALAAALLLLALLGTVLFAVGLSRVIDFWIGVQGIGYVIVGAFLLSLLPAFILLMTRRKP